MRAPTTEPPLARTLDPETSHAAADGLNSETVTRQMAAVLELLTEEPRDDRELVDAYFNLADEREWPHTEADSIRKRRSHLSKMTPPRVVAEGRHRSRHTGKLVTVWKVAAQ